MPMQLSEFNLNELVPEVMAELDPVIARSKLTVTPQLSPEPPLVFSDRQKVKQIVVNLLSNALKFTHQGGDRDRASSSTRRRGRRRSRSRDTGIGIAPEHHERIFEDFRQVDDSPSRQYGGTGLGLAICRRLATALGGRITLHSNVGQGSTLHADDSRGSTAMSTEQGPLILVVDDYEDAREMYAEYLRFSGFRVAEARNGNEALEQAFALMPDLILMDLSLPGMDGWEATRQLKADERDPAHSGRGADRPRARRRVRGRQEGRLRFVRDQTVPARRSRGRGPADAEPGQDRRNARGHMAKSRKSRRDRKACARGPRPRPNVRQRAARGRQPRRCRAACRTAAAATAARRCSSRTRPARRASATDRRTR